MSADLWPEYRDFVGFYWTYPVPSAGFTSLPTDADAAARLSKTIRYQRDSVRAYVAGCKGRLIDEIVYLEVSPDRGTRYAEPALTRALKACAGGKAQLLYVDFAEGTGWRQHPFLMRLMQQAPVSCMGLPAEPMVIDGDRFDPIAHFRQHRAASKRLQGAEDRRRALAHTVAATAADVGDGPGRYKTIADRLNASGIRTTTGRSWTEGNVKQFLRTATPVDE